MSISLSVPFSISRPFRLRQTAAGRLDHPTCLTKSRFKHVTWLKQSVVADRTETCVQSSPVQFVSECYEEEPDSLNPLHGPGHSPPSFSTFCPLSSKRTAMFALCWHSGRKLVTVRTPCSYLWQSSALSTWKFEYGKYA